MTLSAAPIGNAKVEADADKKPPSNTGLAGILGGLLQGSNPS